MQRSDSFWGLLSRAGIWAMLYTNLLQAQPTPITRNPFSQVTGGVIIIRAQLAPFSDTLQFIFDTGSSGISLDSSTVRYLGLEPEFSGQFIRGVAGIREVPLVRNRSLQIGDLRADSLTFYVNDYSVLTAIYGLRIDGVIGYALLSRYIIAVDYDKQIMEWHLPGTYEYPRRGFLLQPQINRLPSHPFVIQDLQRTTHPMMIDLGAGLNLLFSQRYAEEAGILNPQRRQWLTSGEGIGGQINLKLRILPRFEIGPYRFKKIPVTVFDDPYNVTNYPLWAGLVGNDLLRRFNLVINYPKGEIHLRPNRFFTEAFDYGYVGLELYLINGAVEIGFVAPDSPAAEAGLQVGDEIIAINKIIGGNLDAYKTALAHAYKKVSIIYRRGTKIQHTSVQVIRIK